MTSYLCILSTNETKTFVNIYSWYYESYLRFLKPGAHVEFIGKMLLNLCCTNEY